MEGAQRQVVNNAKDEERRQQHHYTLLQLHTIQLPVHCDAHHAIILHKSHNITSRMLKAKVSEV